MSAIELRSVVFRQSTSDKNGANRRWIEVGRMIEVGPGVNWENQDRRGAQLVGVDLSGANLRGCDLSGANLSGANLSGANLTRSRLTFAQMRGAILRGCNLHEAKMKGANLVHVDLSEVKMDNNGIDYYLATIDGDIDFYTYLKHFNPTWEPKVE